MPKAEEFGNETTKMAAVPQAKDVPKKSKWKGMRMRMRMNLRWG